MKSTMIARGSSKEGLSQYIRYLVNSNKHPQILREYVRRTRDDGLRITAGLKKRLQSDELIHFTNGIWSGLFDLAQPAERVFLGSSRDGVEKASSVLLDLQRYAYLEAEVGESILGEVGYFVVYMLRNAFKDYSHTCEAENLEFVPLLIEKLQQDEQEYPSGDRGPYKEQQHRKWQKLHEEEGKSYAAIARLHKQETQNDITASAVGKAIRRLRVRDISKCPETFEDIWNPVETLRKQKS